MSRKTSLANIEHDWSNHIPNEYRDFVQDSFNSSQYLAQTLKDSKDLQIVLANLNFGVSNLAKQIEHKVRDQHENLLQNLSNVNELQNVLESVRNGIASLKLSMERWGQRIQVVADLLRRIIRFQQLVKRLELEYSKEDSRDLTKLALTLHELDTLCEESNFDGLEIIESEIPKLKETRRNVEMTINELLENGLSKQRHADIASAIQIYHNLGQLRYKITHILNSGLAQMTDKIKQCFNMGTYQKEMRDSTAQSSKRTADSSSSTSSQWIPIFWTRLERLLDFSFGQFVRINVLEKVLARTRNPKSQLTFLDEVMKDRETGLLQEFWQTLSISLEYVIFDVSKTSPVLHNLLINNYPRLLRLVHEFFSRISVVSGTVHISDKTSSPESVLLLRSIIPLESSYVSKSLARLYDPVNLAFSSSGSRCAPSRNDMAGIVRVISSELELIKFDKPLFSKIAKNVMKSLRLYAQRTESMVAIDSTAYAIMDGPSSSSQSLNIDLLNSIYLLTENVGKIVSEYDAGMVNGIVDIVQDLKQLLVGIFGPLLQNIQKELELTILKIHREDFTRTQLIATRVLTLFVRHASVIRLSNETVKLRLTNDMAQVEFLVNQFLMEFKSSLGELSGGAYKMIKAFRQLLFADLHSITLASPALQSLPAIIILNNFIARSPGSSLVFPHHFCSWTDEEYSVWLERNKEEDYVSIVEKCMNAYVEDVKRTGGVQFVAELAKMRELIADWKNNKGLGR
ncbi:hypothetical protein BKA69DRAFT_1124811 [Paraphysoderma sedebokerense]|nr:hypothetical protein BKA69DRAFT_1124811 [Paraphysoderma sedebokerense]